MFAVKLLRHGHREWVVICFCGAAPSPGRRDPGLSTSVLGEVCIHHVDHAPYSQKPCRLIHGVLVAPFLLLDLALLSGLPWIDLLALLVVAGAMILTLLFYVLLHSHGYVVIRHTHIHGCSTFCLHRGGGWGWYAFSCLLLLYIFYQLLVNGRKSRWQGSMFAVACPGLDALN